MRFEDLKIIEPILRALKDKNYQTATPIQEQAIPKVLQRKDILGCAQTGTGKTAAFSLPIIQLIHQREQKATKPVLRSLILTPTRELAIQIDENIKAYSKYTEVKHAVIFGGVKQHKQVERLRKGVHILVATPGRLLDLIGQGLLSIDQVKVFVLDEADRMLDMGFIHDIKKVIRMLPKQRQSLFFSATMPKHIVDLSKEILNDPLKVEVARVSSAAETVEQKVYFTNRTHKKALLEHLLTEYKDKQVLLFARTKHGADRIAKNLKKQNFSAFAIHGNKSQNQRQYALKQFKENKVKVLVATDIAARGIDINKLDMVINYDIPNIAETYVHRIGRTGRAGASGLAISISEPEDNVNLRGIEKLIKKKLVVVTDHDFPQTDKPMTEAERKEWNKEKQKRKQEFFQKRKEKKTAQKQTNKERPTKGTQPQSSSKPKASSKKKSNKPNFSKKKKSNTSVSSTFPSSLKKKMMWPLD